MDFIYFFIIGLAVTITLGGVVVIIKYSDDLPLIFKIVIPVILVSPLCIGVFWLNQTSKEASLPLTSQSQMNVYSVNLAPFDDGSYIKKDNEYSNDYEEQYVIRIFSDNQNSFTEKTISGEITYYYTTDEPHIEQYLEKEQYFLSDAKYSYKIYLPKTEEKSANTSENDSEDTTVTSTSSIDELLPMISNSWLYEQ